MRHPRNFFPLLFLAVLACNDDDSGGLDEGRLTIRMTDAPGDVKTAFIQIDRFVLVGSDSTTDRVEIEPEEAGFIDLLTLSGGRFLEVVEDVVVPEGTYSELRLVLADGFVELKDGRVFATSGATLPVGITSSGELKCPSCSQSGFKVKFNGGLTVTDNTIVTIDFDVAQSFGHEAGNSGKWILRPVLRATTSSVRAALLDGTVTLATGVTMPACGGAATTLAHFTPAAIMGSDTIAGTTTAAGTFRIANLFPGTYQLSLLRDVTFTNGDSLTLAATPTPASVSLAAGDSTGASFRITAASCH